MHGYALGASAPCAAGCAAPAPSVGRNRVFGGLLMLMGRALFCAPPARLKTGPLPMPLLMAPARHKVKIEEFLKPPRSKRLQLFYQEHQSSLAPPKPFCCQASNTVTATALANFNCAAQGTWAGAGAAPVGKTFGESRTASLLVRPKDEAIARLKLQRKSIAAAVRGQGKHALRMGPLTGSKMPTNRHGGARGRTRGNPAQRGACGGLPWKSPAAQSDADGSPNWPPGG